MIPTRKTFAIKQRKRYPELLKPVIDPDARIIWGYVELSINVTIGPKCVIGYQGVGYVHDDNQWLHIPQVGKVVINENVHIYPGTHIQRGTIDNTIIGEGTIIGHNCNIAHNVHIGKNCLLTNGVIVAGSTHIGDNVYIGPGVIIRNNVKILDNVHIAQGSNVLNDLTMANYWYMGNPAKLSRMVREGDV